MFRPCVAIPYAFCLAAWGAGATSADSYFTALGAFGGNTSVVGSFVLAGGINNNGMVAGYAETATSGVNHGFYYDGMMHDIGSLNPTYGSPAFAVNAAGDLAGWTYDNSDPTPQRVAYRYSGGTIHPMTNLASDGNGYAINAAGLVGGVSRELVFNPDGSTQSTRTHAIVWNADGSVYADIRPVLEKAGLGVSPGQQQVNALNSTYAVGDFTSGVANRPFEYNLTTGAVSGMRTLGSNYSPMGINDQNVVIGYGNDGLSGGAMRALKYDTAADTIIALGALSGYNYSRAYSINHNGDAVGCAYNGSSAERAVLFKADGTKIDLTAMYADVLPEDWVLQNATAINDNGWIAGYGTNRTNTRGFLLKPALPGDANLDGRVEIADLNKLLTNYDKSGMTWGQGDFDASGRVDISDLNKVLTNYDKSIGSSAAGLKAVPEPGILTLAASALLSLLVYGWRKRK